MANDLRRREAVFAVWVPLLGGTFLFAVYEVGVRQTDAYLGPALSMSRATALGLSALGLASGSWYGARLARRSVNRGSLLIRIASLLAAACAASGPIWFAAFSAPRSLPLVASVLPFLVAFLAGSGLGALTWSAAVAYRELSAVRVLLSPFALAGALFFSLGASIALSYLGLWRGAAVVAGCLAALAVVGQGSSEYLGDLTPPRPRTAFAALTAGVVSFASAQAFVPARVLARYPAEIVWVDDAAGTAIVAAQNTFELFEGDQLRATSADDYRLGELAVHPALSALPSRRSVLVLGPAGGVLEREVLRYSDVDEVVSLSELERGAFSRILWPSQSSDGRQRVIVAEPIPWLEQQSSRFDAIFLSLPMPSRVEAGKYYTRYFLDLAASRLTQQGMLALQAVPRDSMPRTFATLVSTLRSAGLEVSSYDAPLPLLGDVSFLLGWHGRARPPNSSRLPPGLRFLDAAVMRRIGARASPELSEVPFSTLADQTAATSWHHEREQLGD